MNRSVRLLCGIILGVAPALNGYDNAHFYRATNLFFESRIPRDYLSTVDLFFQTGGTSKAWDSNHHKVPLFDLYGTNNMHELSVGVPDKDLNNPLDMILINLALSPSRCSTSTNSDRCISEFATYSINADFGIIEGILSLMQNWKYGFFFQLHLPVRQLTVRNIRFCDLSPTDNRCPNINTPIWQAFQENFDAILERYHLKRGCYSHSSVGDLTALAGWAYSYQESDLLDFIDSTFKVGLSIPSGDAQDPDLIFSLPFGYNKHFGANIQADFAFGAFDWLTMGGHFDVTVFADKNRCTRIKTGPKQNGIIKLAKTNVKEEMGSVWHLGAYLKADHILRGLSFLFGYSYAMQGRNYLTPDDTDKYPPSIVNTDTALFSWKMHTIHLWLEYDFAKENSIWGPRISFYYNRPIGGKRVFTTDIFGGNVGLDIAWNL